MPTLLLSLLLTACTSEEPVLRGVPDEPLLVAQPTAVDLARRIEAPDDTRQYEKPAGVYIDVAWLGGRAFKDHREVISDQLGGLVQAQDLAAGDGQELVFERGTVRVLDGDIYMIDVALPAPLRRTEALASVGFPPHTGRWVTLHREYRLNNVWDFRRLRLTRVDSEQELVDRIQAWKRVPGETVPTP
ncbi:MAG: hypothetical protein H6742_04325 [Alphaproteobacteria bacterium]|nr:hypothetical protein [Alphaproteobacteria bacterium]